MAIITMRHTAVWSITLVKHDSSCLSPVLSELQVEEDGELKSDLIILYCALTKPWH